MANKLILWIREKYENVCLDSEPLKTYTRGNRSLGHFMQIFFYAYFW